MSRLEALQEKQGCADDGRLSGTSCTMTCARVELDVNVLASSTPDIMATVVVMLGIMAIAFPEHPGPAERRVAGDKVGTNRPKAVS